MNEKVAWRLIGDVPQRPRPNWTAAALALIFAGQTFVAPSGDYPGYMCLLAFVAAAYFAYLAWRRRVLIGLLLLPVSWLWLNPLSGGDWFSTLGVVFMLCHSALALLFGTAAYTYAAEARD